MKKTTLFITLICCCAFLSLSAQDSVPARHTFTKLQLETRFDFDYIAPYDCTLGETEWGEPDYGVHGRYLFFKLGGDFGKGFSYYLTQRMIAHPGSVNFFDNTDYLYLQYAPNEHWAFRLGKEALAVGGFEYDAAPIDVYFYTRFWSAVACYQLGGSVIYTDKSKKNTVQLQVSNSPYTYYAGSGDEWKQGLFGYSVYWLGNFNVFQAIYSINLFERKRGSFVNYISLGNKFNFGRCSWYIDYMNRAVDFEHFFEDFSLVSRLDVTLPKGISLFAKGGYDQNLAEDFWTDEQKDIMMTPGESYFFYGLGLEFRPVKYQDIRLHCFVSAAETRNTLNLRAGYLNANIGLSWKLDFLRYFSKKLNPSK